ncbi:MAG: hypothetical protein HMLIMOIP_000234 [Candidatus Nitrosomirales archaeon]|jgi:hypothetical protein
MKRVILSVGLATGLFFVGLYLIYSGGVNLSDFITGITVAIFIGIASVLVWGFKPQIATLIKTKKEPQTNRKFGHLTIHYSQRTDTPDTPSPARPRYVTNNTTKHAYWVSTQLEEHIKKHHINWHSHDSGLMLNNYLLKNRYVMHDHDATPEELGMDEL